MNNSITFSTWVEMLEDINYNKAELKINGSLLSITNAPFVLDSMHKDGISPEKAYAMIAESFSSFVHTWESQPVQSQNMFELHAQFTDLHDALRLDGTYGMHRHYMNALSWIETTGGWFKFALAKTSNWGLDEATQLVDSFTKEYEMYNEKLALEGVMGDMPFNSDYHKRRIALHARHFARLAKRDCEDERLFM